MVMFIAIPKKRINQFTIGDSVIVKGTHYKEPFKIVAIDSDGYYELKYKDQPIMSVSPLHEVE